MPKKKNRIMVFGTFDFLHKGHLNFFRQARRLAKRPYLIVSIARDINVKKIKGRKPQLNERQRLAVLRRCQLVDKAVLGGLKSHLPHIINEKPEIIGLGYDQVNYIKNLRKDLKSRGLAVSLRRLKPFRPKIYKSSLFKKKI